MVQGQAREEDAVTWDAYLAPTLHIDSDAAEIRDFARKVVGGAEDLREKAMRLFRAVRDGIAYTPYAFSLSSEAYKASCTLASGRSFCVPKAVLLAAVARAVGIPSRLVFADVVNHLATDGLRQLMETDVFVFHGYTELHLEGRWLKVTPTFDSTFCERFGVLPLVFDGQRDAVFHPFDKDGRKHMEYVRDRGSYADLPFDEIVSVYRETYPTLLTHLGRL